MQLIKTKIDSGILVGLIIFVCTVSTGILTSTFHDQKQYSNHYTNFIPSSIDSLVNLTFKIREVIKPGIYHSKYIIDILTIDSKKVKGRLLLNIEKDSLNEKLQVDQFFFVRASLQKINTPLNPHQFDYNNYLSYKYIYHQLYLPPTSTFKVQSSARSILGYAAFLRQYIQEHLSQFNFQDDELSIINALLLGQRQDISKEIYENYAKAGAIHILAVSGLHIGIILILLQRLFKFLDFIKKGKLIRIVVILSFLWCYAVVAGLSASVVRAVTMFTVFAIAMNLKRPTNVYNTIAISIFMLLLFKPNFLFDVGFQLSYLAVLAIVTVEPFLSGLWKPRLKIIRFFWRIMTVTLAAQLGVVPISLYYFHQFPGLFFLSNLVIIPCLGLILGFGILVIVLASINGLPVWVATCYGSIIKLMNGFIRWVSDQEAAVFQNISFGIAEVIFSYAIIIVILLLIWKATFRHLFPALILVVSFQTYLLIKKKKESDKAVVVFHKSRMSLLGFKKDRAFTVHADLDYEQLKSKKFLTNYIVGEDLELINSDTLGDFYFFDHNKMLIVDSLGIYNLSQFKPNIILLRNSPKINLKRLIDSVKPELIICDGSNFTSYQNRWARTCELKKIPFHQTSKKGAFIYRY